VLLVLGDLVTRKEAEPTFPCLQVVDDRGKPMVVYRIGGRDTVTLSRSCNRRNNTTIFCFSLFNRKLLGCVLTLIVKYNCVARK